ncbi:MAG: BlaI/MecI/CopY family transcriptional regulator [Clostridia bacterium]|nr:BlaI/MecI/CopY family transcriptional regulator [Clostridia bacterium]MBR5266060.1 BlaI/MecI/CopY family transcriptional regulator [Clostridia bacterium]
MKDTKLGAVESRFADIIWDNQPIASGELVKLCENQLSWKKSTTYTVLKKLCERGIFKNEGGVVSSLISRDEYYSVQSNNFVKELFHGSLPAFIASFASNKKLSDEEIDELQKLIDESRVK